MKVIKISRGQYQVVDESGKQYFAYPTSKHEANMFIIDTKIDAKFLADDRMQRVAMKYINDNKLSVSAYGDLKQFMAGYIYKMYHRDLRDFMKRPYLFREHIEKTAAQNRAAREASLINNNYMENQNQTPVKSSPHVQTVSEMDMFCQIHLGPEMLKKWDEVREVLYLADGLPHAEKNPETIQEEAHGLVHEIAYNVREGNIQLAQQQIKRVDELLHIMCEPGVISH